MWRRLVLAAAPAVLLLSATAPALEPPTFVFLGVTWDGERIGWRPR